MAKLECNASPLPADHGLVQLLGEELVSKKGNVKTVDALGGKSAIALYFSAHWCPPCRNFTPKFAENYTSNLKDKGLEVVFVSSDRDKAAFESYYNESHPWLALPYENRDLKDKLSKMCKVQGIPSVVVLDAATGKISNLKGRDCVMTDAKGEKLPWAAPTLVGALGSEFTSKDGTPLTLQSLAGKHLGLYFSASWCPPCQGFTPKLIETYNKLKEQNEFEVVFVSSDKDQASFDEYYKKMPWACISYDQRTRKQDLSSVLDVNGIPCLVMLKVAADGKSVEIVSEDACGKVRGDAEGKNFPWVPDTVIDMTEDADGIDEQPSVCVLFEKNASEDKKKALSEKVVSVLKPFGDKYAALKKSSGEDLEFAFYYCNDDHAMADRVRSFCQQDEASEGRMLILLLDIQSGMSYYESGLTECTSEGIEKLIGDFKAGKLEKKTMKPN